MNLHNLMQRFTEVIESRIRRVDCWHTMRVYSGKQLCVYKCQKQNMKIHSGFAKNSISIFFCINVLALSTHVSTHERTYMQYIVPIYFPSPSAIPFLLCSLHSKQGRKTQEAKGSIRCISKLLKY